MPAEISGPADERVLAAALSRVIERNMAYSLAVSDGVSERFFYFAIGGIRVIGSGPRRTSTTASLLAEAGKLTKDDVDRVLASSGQDGQLFGETVVAMGLISKADLDEAARAKVQDELLDLFLWEGAELRLEEGQPPASFYEGRFEAARISCNVGTLLQTVLARVEEWRAVLGRLPGLREVFEASTTALKEYEDGAKGRLARHLDGNRTLAEAIERSGVRRSSAYEALLEMLRDTRVRRAASGAAQKVTRDELVREIAALEDALATAVDPTVVRARLARALEAAGESARASAQWRFLGDHFRRENQLERALECYRAGVRTVPTDFATRELVLEIHRHNRDYGQLVADGRPLAELFLKHNLLNRAKNLLAQLVGLEPQDTGLRRQLIMVLIGLGEREMALKHLRDLAKILEQRKAPLLELRDVYLRILALDPKDRHAQDRLDTITGAKFQRRMLRVTLGATAAALVVIGAWFLLESAARSSVNEAISEAKRLAEKNDFGAAKEGLRRTIDEYSYSRASGAAYDLLQAIERYELRERERLSQNVGSVRSSAERDEAAARVLVQRAIELTEAGSVEEAHRTYRELFDVFGDVPIVDTVSLPLQLTVCPLDARVRLAGQEIGEGALLLRYSPRAKCTLQVEREGYVTFKKVLDGPQDATLDVSLEKPTRWVHQSDAAIDAPPLAAAGMVYVAGRDRCVTALAASDGSVQWRTPLGVYSDVSVRPVLTEAGLFVTTATGEALLLDPSTGDVRWRRDTGSAIDRQPVAAGASAVLVSGNDGSMRAYAAASGDPMWTLPPGTAAGAAAVLDDGRLAYVDPKGSLVIADAGTGLAAPGQSTSSALRGTPVPDEGRLWVRSEDGALCVVSTATQRALRRCPVPAAAEIQPTVTANGVYAASSEGALYAFHPTGEAKFRVKLSEPASASPTLSRDRLYVPGAKGRMSVLDARTGELVWRFDAKSRITSPPVADDGTIYVVTAGGRVYAIDE